MSNKRTRLNVPPTTKEPPTVTTTLAQSSTSSSSSSPSLPRSQHPSSPSQPRSKTRNSSDGSPRLRKIPETARGAATNWNTKERSAIEALSSLTWRTSSKAEASKSAGGALATREESSASNPKQKSKSPMDKILSGPTTTTGGVSLGTGDELKASEKASSSTSLASKNKGQGDNSTESSKPAGTGSTGADESTVKSTTASEPTTYTSYVFSWFSSGAQTSDATPPKAPEPVNKTTTTTRPPTLTETEAATPSKSPQDAPRPASSPIAKSTTAADTGDATNPSTSSWFYFWSQGEQPKPTVDDSNKKPDDDNKATTEEQSKPGPDVPEATTQSSPAKAQPIPATVVAAKAIDDLPRPSSASSLPSKSSGWTFWGKPQTSSTSTLPTDAVAPDAAASSSSSKPTTTEGSESKPPVAAKPTTDTASSKQREPGTAPTIKPSPKPVAAESIPTKAVKVAGTNETTTQSAVASLEDAKNSRNNLPPNLLVPSFESCYPNPKGYGIISSITRLFGPARAPRQQLNLIRPPRIRKAVAIGVHGFFPMKLLQRVLGEPTGTSLRFATAGAAAIERWARANSMRIEVEKIALEGEGKVADRVEVLWKLLGKYIDTVKQADFVFIVCHSQGTPVGTMLSERLFTEGVVDRAKVGILAMAGISLGPFPEFKSRILSGSARELFDFYDPDSRVSKDYLRAIRICISRGAKVTYVGSIDDQLVPMSSSFYSNISHPFIFRACFVDGRIHVTNFLTHLVGFALKLRNWGISDHSVIKELSAPLAGSLYSGEGHSRIYDDNSCYDIAVRHALETSTLDYINHPLRVDPVEPASTNPFFLPWSMRGLLEEKIVREEMSDEAALLLQQFDQWKPASKALKDVKYRLDAIKSINVKSKL